MNTSVRSAFTGLAGAATLALAASTAFGQPVVTNLLTSVHATVTDPLSLSFDAQGALFAGRDAGGSGGSSAAAVRIHRIAPGGDGVAEFGDVAIPDPDALIVDRLGLVSGIAGAVIVGGVFSGNEGRISRVAPDGTVSALFGPSAQYGNPSGFALEADGALLFTDLTTGSVFRTRGTAPVKLFSVSNPVGIEVDALGRIVVSSSSGTRLALYASDGSLLNANLVPAANNSPLARGPGGAWTTDLHAISPTGSLFRISPAGEVTVIGSGFGSVTGLAFGPDGALYASAFNLDRVYRIGLPSVPGATVAVHAEVTDPVRIAAAPDGTLFVGRDASGSGGDFDDAVKVHRIGPGGSPVTEYGEVPVTDPDGVAYDATGSATGIPGAVVVGGHQLNSPAGKVVAFRPDQTLVTLLGPTGFTFNPNYFILDRTGRMLFTDNEGGRVWVMTNGVASILFALPGALQIEVDALDRILVGVEDSPTLRLYSPAGTLLDATAAAVAPNSPLARGPGGFWGTGVHAVDARGRLVSIATDGSVTVRGTGFPVAYGMCFGPDDALYLTDFGGDRIWRVEPASARPALSIRLDGPSVRVEWRTSPGRTDQLQWAPSLPANPWSNLGAPVSGDGTLTGDSIPLGDAPARFFRLVPGP